MGRNTMALQHDSSGIHTKCGSAIRLAENVFVPDYGCVGTMLSGEVQIHLVVFFVSIQAHHYGLYILDTDVQLG